METQECCICRELRPMSEFAPSARGLRGVRCIGCRREAYNSRRVRVLTRDCPICHGSFAVTSGNKLYCSEDCRKVAYRTGRRAKLIARGRVPTRAGEIDSATCSRCGDAFDYVILRKARTLCDECRRRRPSGIPGLSLVAAKSLREQTTSCAVCGATDAQWHIDHDHDTNEVRGVLCRHCNIGLGHFFDNPELLRAAAAYLDVAADHHRNSPVGETA